MLEPIIHFTRHGDPITVGFRDGRLHDIAATHRFLAHIESGQFCYDSLRGTKKQIARGWIFKVLSGGMPIRCSECGSRYAPHLHHIFGEENSCYRSWHTPAFIRANYKILCAYCHAAHHGDSDIASFAGPPPKDLRIDLLDKMARARRIAEKTFVCIQCHKELKDEFESNVNGLCVICNPDWYKE